jgi:predicted phosphodiesterase
VGALVVVLVAAALAVVNRRAVEEWITLRRGAPGHTEVYRAFSTPPQVRIAAVGDGGEPGPPLDAVSREVRELSRGDPYDALVLLGDNVYPDGDPEGLEETVFQPFGPLLFGGTALLAVLGNHDVQAGHGRAQLEALGQSGRFWARTFGSEVLIVGLDSNEPDDREQRAFLEDTLKGATARWKIVVLHHPPYSAGREKSDKEVRRAFSPLFSRYGVQLVLSGHSHDYQRSVPVDGVTYIVSGAGSKKHKTGKADFTEESFATYHFLDISTFPNELVVRAVDSEGRVADQVFLTR